MYQPGQFETVTLDDEIFIPEHLYASPILNQCQDDGKLDTLESHSSLPKPLGYCCKDDELPMMKMERLENPLLRKDPANIEPLFRGIRHQIAIGVAQSLLFLHSVEKDIVYRDFKASNILLDEYPTSLSDFGLTPHNSITKVNAIDTGDTDDFMALDISSVLTQSEKTDKEIKKSRRECGTFGDKNDPSHLRNHWPHVNIESNFCPKLLLMATLLSTTTFLLAFKIRGCIFEEGYKYISSLNPVCQIVIRHPYVIQLVIAFNSIAFFLSIILLMILFNKLPLRPLLLVCASSMLGAYMCIISGPSKPLLSSS